MRLEQLEYLVAISKEKSLSAASEKLHVSHQAVSVALKSLEDELQTNLLNRTYTGVSLTEDGKIFLAFAMQTLKSLEETTSLLSNAKKKSPPLQGELKVYANSIYTLSILPAILTRFHHQYPNVSVSIFNTDTANIYNKLHQAQTKNNLNVLGLIHLVNMSPDLEITSQIDPSFLFHPLLISDLRFCVSKLSPLAKYKHVSLRTITKFPFVAMMASDDSDCDYLRTLFQNYGTVKIACSASSYHIWLDAITKNLGTGVIQEIALLSDSLIKKDFDDLIILPTKEKISNISGYLTFPSPTPLVSAFIDFLPKMI